LYSRKYKRVNAVNKPNTVSYRVFIISEDFIDSTSRNASEYEIGVLVVGKSDKPDGKRPNA
jgi:hypothetical protein